MKKLALFSCLLIVTIANTAFAQHIFLQNPSLEGSPAAAKAPPGWVVAAETPDIQPGRYGIKLPPSDGNTYVGLHSGFEYKEGIAQLLPLPLKAGRTYRMTLDLAFAPEYVSPACYGNLEIYGGNTPGDTTQLLWASGAFTHTGWKKYQVELKPQQDYSYISLWAKASLPCNVSVHPVALLMDNLSPIILEAPRLTLSARPSCSSVGTGSAGVTAAGAQAPYRYKWTPGNDTTAQIRNLLPGIYEVTVTDVYGSAATDSVRVGVADLQSTAAVTPAGCYMEHENQIAVNTSGGMPPYRYYLNGSSNGSYTPVFDQLAPGDHHIVVKDERTCADTLNVTITPPPPLVAKAHITPSLCSEVTNGKIGLAVTGGVPPYEYRVDDGPWKRDSLFDSLGAGRHRFEVRDANGCGYAGMAEVTTPYQNCIVVMPSAFSPNGDGNNDVLRPKVYDAITNFRLRVYNRWGTLIFESNDPQQGWDGTYKGAPQGVQTLVYICAYNDRNNQRQEMKGTVTLVR